MKNFNTILSCMLVIGLFASCNNASEKSSEKKDTTVVEKKTVDSVAIRMAGVYSGNIPCADCAGIMTFLSLDPGMTYRIEETYIGKSDTAYLNKGTWKRDGDKIELYDNDKIRVSYLAEGDNLLQLDIEGRRISGNLGDRYRLVRNQVANNPGWKEKKDAGIDFVGLGNEPFWSLDIAKNGQVSFNTPDMKAPAKFPYTDATKNGTAMEYNLKDGSNRLDLTITPRYCSDGMSDFVYEYSVSLKYNGKKYTGCGAMLNSL